ncbi:DMT family transporter [Haloferacaceae archaeon DSL9]
MSRTRDLGLFVLLAFLWGTTYVAIEVGLETLPPLLFVALRFDIAAILLVGFVVLRRSDPVPSTRADWFGVAAGSVFVVALNNSFLFVGQQYTPSGIAAIAYSLVPIFTTAFAALLLRTGGLDGRGYLGVILGIVGVGFVAQPDPANLTGGVTRGVALITVAVVSVSLGSVVLRRLRTTCSSLTLTAWSMAGGAVVVHLGSLLAAEPFVDPRVDPLAVVALGYLGIGSSAIAYAIYFSLLGKLGPFQINLVSYLVPMIAALAGWALLAESLSALTVVGFGVIVVGFALVKHETVAAELARARTRLSARQRGD